MFHREEFANLTQVFANVGFLGCRCPVETMKVIEELSMEIVKDCRENQKSSLQRPFVMASDAACSEEQSKQEGPTNENNVEEYASNSCDQPLLSSKTQVQDPEESNLEVMIIEPTMQIKEDVLFECLSETSQGIEIINDTSLCTVLYDCKVATDEGPNQEAAKKEAAEAALKEVEEIYCTAKLTQDLTPTVTENLAVIEASNSECNSNVIGSNNVGMKMMKLMGWSGGGLGKASQGITEPVSVQPQKTRNSGLGFKPDLPGTFMEVGTPGYRGAATPLAVKTDQLADERARRKQKKKAKRRLLAAQKQMLKKQRKAARAAAASNSVAQSPVAAHAAVACAPGTGTHRYSLRSAVAHANGAPLPKKPEVIASTPDVRARTPGAASVRNEPGKVASTTPDTGAHTPATDLETANNAPLSKEPGEVVSAPGTVDVRKEPGEVGRAPGTSKQTPAADRAGEGAQKRGLENPPPGGSTTPKQSKRTSNSGRPPSLELKLAVVPDAYPEERLSEEQARLVVRAMTATILDMPEGCYVPRFRDNWFVRGTQVFHCNNQEDKQWLLQNVSELVPWEGAKLRVIELSLVEKVEKVTIFVRGEYTAEEVLQCLGKQNSKLRVPRWWLAQTWHARDEAQGTVETAVTVFIEDCEFDALSALGFRPFCGAGRAHVVPHKKSARSQVEMNKELTSADRGADSTEPLSISLVSLIKGNIRTRLP